MTSTREIAKGAPIRAWSPFPAQPAEGDDAPEPVEDRSEPEPADAGGARDGGKGKLGKAGKSKPKGKGGGGDKGKPKGNGGGGDGGDDGRRFAKRPRKA